MAATSKKIEKVLIANRGEIALRILRACQDQGIKTVVCCSTADKKSMPAQLADEVVCIGNGTKLTVQVCKSRVMNQVC